MTDHAARDWLSRWRERRIGFHRSAVHPLLAAHWAAVAPRPGTSVLVPLAGKSLDMHWLAERGHRVIGIELADVAVEAFFEEAGVTPTRGTHEGLPYLEYDRVRIYIGDFFDLAAAHLDDVRACYDRAALVALDADTRRRYASRLIELLAPGTKMLLVSVDYPQDDMRGPPFAVSGQEVHALFDEAFSLDQLAVVDVLGDEPKFRERGVSAMVEVVWQMMRRPPASA